MRLVVEAAHSLGLKVCAEGIELRAQADQLIAMGCEAAQGYLLGVPTPADLIDPHPRGLVVSHPEAHPAALVGQRAIDYLHPDDRNRQVGAHFPTDSAARTVVRRVRHAAGHTVWVESHIRTIVNPDTGAPVEVLSTTTDVSARVQAQRELSDRARRLAAAFDAAPSAWPWSRRMAAGCRSTPPSGS